MSDDPQRGAPRQDDWVPEDDAIIGRVFRWSVGLVAVAAVLGFVAFQALRSEPEVERVVAKDLSTIPDAPRRVAEIPDVPFADVTSAAGIDFVHSNGARGEKLLPETMGSGAAFFDYDGDGDPDLLLVNAHEWPETARGAAQATSALYRNDGSGNFEDVSRAAGLDVTLFGTGVAVGDVDNDGDRDVFLAALGPDRMLRNDEGRFVDVTRRAGVAGPADGWSTSAGFFDYDSDGDLDLFVCNYVRWSRAIDLELNFSLNGTDRAYGPPTNYAGSFSRLYRNDGTGRFEDVSAAAGIQVANPSTGEPMGKALAVAFADFDRDGHPDVVVANDTIQNFLFHNRGDGTFEEIGALSGIGFDSAGNATGAMGVDTAHYRDDEQLAIGIANFANEMTSLYVTQRGDLRFTDEAIGEGIGAPSRRYLSFGLFFFDYDLDGRLDFLQANGHLEDEIAEVQASQTYEQPAQLFWNAGPDRPSCYVEAPARSVGDLARPIVGRAATYADIDADGDLDVLLTQSGGAPLLLRNDQRLDHGWLRVDLEGTRSNRDAIGARVELEAGGRKLSRQVMPTRSYLSQVEPAVTFGLGSGGRVDALRVIWPDGSVQEVAAATPGTRVRVVQE